LRSGVKPEQIGIITPYEGQRAYLVQFMQHQGSLHAKLYQDIEIASVDAFQGREKDFIIMSCVRSNENQGIGFLNDPRRLNVALTRARYGIIIVGNPKVLAKQPVWNHLLHFYKENRVLIEGALNNLKESMMQFPKPKKPINSFNPGQHFMSTAVYDARQAMVPGSVYDRSGLVASANNNGMASYIPRAMAHAGDSYSRLHDPIGYIAPERAQAVAALPAMPVPVGVFMNMTHVPPRFHNQDRMQSKPGSRAKSGPDGYSRSAGMRSKAKAGSSLFTQSPMSQNTQDISTQPFSQGGIALTQGMSQGLSQTVPGFGALSQSGLSQLDPSQDAFLSADFQSQMDGLLSQDSTYQGGRSAFMRQGSQFTQPY